VRKALWLELAAFAGAVNEDVDCGAKVAPAHRCATATIAPALPGRCLAGYSPDTPRSSSDLKSEELRGVSGEATARLRPDSGAITGVRAGIGCQAGESCGSSGLASWAASPGAEGSPGHEKPVNGKGRRGCYSLFSLVLAISGWDFELRVPCFRTLQGCGSQIRPCTGRGNDDREAAASVFRRLRRERGRGLPLGHRTSRQCAGRCGSKWPCRTSVHRTGQRKAQ